MTNTLWFFFYKQYKNIILYNSYVQIFKQIYKDDICIWFQYNFTITKTTVMCSVAIVVWYKGISNYRLLSLLRSRWRELRSLYRLLSLSSWCRLLRLLLDLLLITTHVQYQHKVSLLTSKLLWPNLCSVLKNLLHGLHRYRLLQPW